MVDNVKSGNKQKTVGNKLNLFRAKTGNDWIWESNENKLLEIALDKSSKFYKRGWIVFQQTKS